MTILASQPDFVGADPGSWQLQMKWAIRTVPELARRLDLPISDKNTGWSNVEAVQNFPVFVPLPYLARITPGDLRDPLLIQVLPTTDEDRFNEGFFRDPLQESNASLGPGILKKYQGRVLLITTGTCAINCRYCFRRHFPYEETPKSEGQWRTSLAQIASDDSLDEVILSGGDPLTLVDKNLGDLVARLDAIAHVKRLRIHTRLPIVIPQRVTDKLLDVLSSTRLNIVLVIHSNHAREIDAPVQTALARLRAAEILLLNQSVLLQGVNDRVDTLIALSQRLIECQVVPYYLHKNDRVAGTSHFEVSQEKGIDLVNQMRTALPGYAVPRFVQEIPGTPSKTILA